MEKVLIEIFHSCSSKMMSNKNLVLFMNWINKENNHTYFRCSEHIASFYHKNNKKYLVFYKNNYFTTQTSFKINNIDTFFHNEWKITIEKNNNDTNNINNVIDIEDVLNGKFSYYTIGTSNRIINYSTKETNQYFPRNCV